MRRGRVEWIVTVVGLIVIFIVLVYCGLRIAANDRQWDDFKIYARPRDQRWDDANGRIEAKLDVLLKATKGDGKR